MILAIIDLETTGLDPQKHEIIEIGLILCDSRNFTILDEWECKVLPERPDDGDAKAFEVNGYDPEEWKDAATLTQAMQELALRTQKATLMAYNCTFDHSFLQQAFRATGVKDTMHYLRLDLMTLAWGKLPHHKMQSWSLKSVCTFLDIPPEPAVHRGMQGAMKAYEVYRRLTEML